VRKVIRRYVPLCVCARLCVCAHTHASTVRWNPLNVICRGIQYLCTWSTNKVSWSS